MLAFCPWSAGYFCLGSSGFLRSVPLVCMLVLDSESMTVFFGWCRHFSPLFTFLQFIALVLVFCSFTFGLFSVVLVAWWYCCFTSTYIDEASALSYLCCQIPINQSSVMDDVEKWLELEDEVSNVILLYFLLFYYVYSLMFKLSCH